MSIEIIGMVGSKEVSESRGSLDGPQVDAGYLARFAQAHENAGFDRVLIGYGATSPDGFAVAAHVLYSTSALKVLIAHRPGFVAPTLVARKLATLDQLTGGGRVAVHHITGGDELDQKRDGDFADHDRRYARTAEFMSLLRRELTGPRRLQLGQAGNSSRDPAVFRRGVGHRCRRRCRARGRLHALG
jgi:alkanesulfonate monooxygenase